MPFLFTTLDIWVPFWRYWSAFVRYPYLYAFLIYIFVLHFSSSWCFPRFVPISVMWHVTTYHAYINQMTLFQNVKPRKTWGLSFLQGSSLCWLVFHKVTDLTWLYFFHRKAMLLEINYTMIHVQWINKGCDKYKMF